MKGFVLLHRQILDSEVFADADLLRLWVWLLTRTAFKRSAMSLSTGRGATTVILNPGQCIVGRHAGSEQLGWPPSTFRDRLNKLEKMGMIDRQPATHWTIVSVVNWGVYQCPDVDETTGNPPPNRQATDNQPTQRNNDNNDNKARSARVFKPPTIEEVKAYCLERTNQVDPEQFIDHYTANGWTQGKGKPIRDWQAAVRTWERNGLRSSVPVVPAEQKPRAGMTIDELAALPPTPRRRRHE